ncbi:MAG: hypothetical protein PHO90_01935 [Candidatus Pacebacteria bacterium]|nr:hypothetical protein [Candidatus Paceibacterota bacterium]
MPRLSDLKKQEKERRNKFLGYLLDCKSAKDENRRNRAMEEMAKLARTFEEWQWVRAWAVPGSEVEKRAIEEMNVISMQAA